MQCSGDTMRIIPHQCAIHTAGKRIVNWRIAVEKWLVETIVAMNEGMIDSETI